MRILNLFSVLNLIFITFVILISGCSTNLNYSQYLDLPKDIYKTFNPVATTPKETGIINFETYAIVRAKKGERLYNVADRINISSKKLAVHNGLSENYQLGQGILSPELLQETMSLQRLQSKESSLKSSTLLGIPPSPNDAHDIGGKGGGPKPWPLEHIIYTQCMGASVDVAICDYLSLFDLLCAIVC